MDIKEVITLVKKAKVFVEDREMAGSVTEKGHMDYVTQVDTNIQNFLAKELAKLAPEIEFLGEETGMQDMKSDTFWILDPIDGTTNLIHDYKHSAISLGLYDKGEIVMGIIYDPFREEVFSAEKGQGAFLNGKPIHVSEAETLADTMISFGTVPYEKEYADENFLRCRRVFDKCQDIRRTGSAAIDLAYVACGRIGGYFEARLSPWDFAAGKILVEEAGGRITQFDGTEVELLKRKSVMASNGKVHEELRKLL